MGQLEDYINRKMDPLSAFKILYHLRRFQSIYTKLKDIVAEWNSGLREGILQLINLLENDNAYKEFLSELHEAMTLLDCIARRITDPH